MVDLKVAHLVESLVVLSAGLMAGSMVSESAVQKVSYTAVEKVVMMDGKLGLTWEGMRVPVKTSELG